MRLGQLAGGGPAGAEDEENQPSGEETALQPDKAASPASNSADRACGSGRRRRRRRDAESKAVAGASDVLVGAVAERLAGG